MPHEYSATPYLCPLSPNGYNNTIWSKVKEQMTVKFTGLYELVWIITTLKYRDSKTHAGLLCKWSLVHKRWMRWNAFISSSKTEATLHGFCGLSSTNGHSVIVQQPAGCGLLHLLRLMNFHWDNCRFTCSWRFLVHFAQFPPVVTFCKATRILTWTQSTDLIQISLVLLVLICVCVCVCVCVLSSIQFYHLCRLACPLPQSRYRMVNGFNTAMIHHVALL